MSANITIREDGRAEVFTGRNIQAWHKLGVTVEGLLTAKQAIIAAGLDWKVKKESVCTLDGREIDNYHAIVREDNGLGLSVVGNRYTPIQNEDAFTFFDGVVGEGQAIYDTAGSLDGGRKVWILARLAGKLFIKNRPEDTLEKQVLLYNPHSSKGCLSLQIVTTRVVCQNTLSVALGTKTNQINIRHTASWQDKSEEAAKTIGLCNAYFDDLQGVIDILSEQQVTASGIKNFAETLLPAIPNEKGQIRPSIIADRQQIVNLFSRGQGNLGQTRWDALNAVTEFVDHAKKVRGGNTSEQRFINSTFGGGADLKAKAFALLTA